MQNSYPSLKEAMGSIKQYEECLKNHFRQLHEAYRNPFEGETERLKQELEKPIIKYDKLKKHELQNRVEALTARHQQLHAQLTEDFDRFLAHYERAILPNHDLFFTKRTLAKLLRPLLHAHPTLTRALLLQEVHLQQQRKQEFLECLSDLVVEVERDKKHLSEDNFTLDEVVQVVLNKNRKDPQPRFSEDFLLYASRKLIKEIKRQFLLKEGLAVENLESFPADQEIPMSLLSTCFEMECTKVLLKNQIWQELLAFLPEPEQQSRLHQQTIEGNFCLELAKRYFLKLDERMKLELSKSKHISLLAENVTLDRFGSLAAVLERVLA
jgi:hypothetical protein